MTSFLLPVNPIGQGTAEVECFASYFVRLAEANGVPVSTLIALTRRASGLRPLSAPDQARGNILRRTTSSLRALLNATEELSGQRGLVRLSMLAATPIVGQGRQHSLRSQAAWCEQCIREDIRTDGPPYERLLWCSEFVIRCPFHKVLLRDKCPSCGRAQASILAEAAAARCHRCQCSLLGPPSQLQPEFKPFFGEAETIELVSAISCGELDATHQGCLDVFYRCLRGLRPTDGDVNLGGTQILSHVQGWTPTPTLASLVGTASKYLVPIVLLIADPEAAARQAINLGLDVESVPGSSLLKVESQLLQSIRVTLERGLAAPQDAPIPTFAQIGTIFSLRTLGFTSAFPHLSKRYNERLRIQAQRITGL